jgi:Xaa-Pro dipeptidase
VKLVDELKRNTREPALAFSRDEYARRLTRTRELMAEQGIDVLLCTNTSNIGYLTGYDTTMPSGYTVLIVPTSGDMTLHCSELEAPCMLLNGLVTDIEVFYWYEAQDTGSDLARVLNEHGHGGKRIGLEMGYPETFASGAFDTKSYITLTKDLPSGTEFVDATLLVLEVRLVKTAQELDYMRTAGTYTWAGLRGALDAVGEGVTDSEIAAAAHHAILGAGSELMSIDPMVITGDRTGYMPHIAHRRVPMKRGDAAYFEFTGSHNRYNAPSMRSAVVGPPSDEVKRLTEVAIETLELLLEHAGPGRTGHDVAQDVRGPLDANPDIFFHGGYGYSIGMGFQPTWTENPVYIAEGADRELVPGMCFHLPICIWIPNGQGIGFSESITITESGCEPLTPNLELELRVVDQARAGA